MRGPVRLTILFAVLATLAACARQGPPAPVSVGSVPVGPAGAARTAPAAQTAPIAPGSTHIVAAGETIFTIARRSGVPTRAIIDANDLSPPYALVAGTRLAIPAVRVHEVRAGDTASQIAARYGVPLRELVRANGIEPPYTIRIGQRLVVPENDATRTEVARAARGTVEAAPLPPPAAPAPAPAPAPATPTTSASPAAPPSQVQTAAPATPPAPANPPAPAPETAAPVAAGRMIWPVRGVVVSEFGPKAGGLQNDGINIAAPRGTAFRAAENGVVIYAGNELRGFGNLLLLRHEGGIVTAYAHADELLVQRGDQVRRGQTIGRVGSSGNVTGPQLHFEVRRGTRAVNPMEFLGAQSAAAD
jgi:murein DD-endopeptidase MepM/ murein hydrolase activator NlpD